MSDITIPNTTQTLLHTLPNHTLTLKPHPVRTPAPNSNEHLIRVHATAICAGELLWDECDPTKNPGAELIPGYDLAGTVITAPSSSPFRAGDEVYGCTAFNRAGNARGYTIARTNELAHKPRCLDWTEAAAVPLSALTAWQALFEHGGLSSADGDSTEGRRVLVTAAAGGVGVWIVQLARRAGMEVIGTCGPDNVGFVYELGAMEGVNYRDTDLRDWVAADEGRKVDLAVDCVGGKALEDCWWCVKDGGTLISIVQPPKQRIPTQAKETGWLDGKNVRDLFFVMHPNGKELKEITELLERGECRPVLDSIWGLEGYERAFERLGSGHARGKVVLVIKS